MKALANGSSHSVDIQDPSLALFDPLTPQIKDKEEIEDFFTKPQDVRVQGDDQGHNDLINVNH